MIALDLSSLKTENYQPGKIIPMFYILCVFRFGSFDRICLLLIEAFFMQIFFSKREYTIFQSLFYCFQDIFRLDNSAIIVRQ